MSGRLLSKIKAIDKLETEDEIQQLFRREGCFKLMFKVL
jgi:hypothetical protein